MNPCRYCVAPKRFPGCKRSCSEYLEWLPGDLDRRATIKKNKEKNAYPFTEGKRKK